MEPVTHFLTGACLGRSGFNRKTAYATLAMTLAAEAPIWMFCGACAARWLAFNIIVALPTRFSVLHLSPSP